MRLVLLVFLADSHVHDETCQVPRPQMSSGLSSYPIASNIFLGSLWSAKQIWACWTSLWTWWGRQTCSGTGRNLIHWAIHIVPPGKLTELWNITILWVNQLFLWAIFYSKLWVYQRSNVPIQWWASRIPQGFSSFQGWPQLDRQVWHRYLFKAGTAVALVLAKARGELGKPSAELDFGRSVVVVVTWKHSEINKQLLILQGI